MDDDCIVQTSRLLAAKPSLGAQPSSTIGFKQMSFQHLEDKIRGLDITLSRIMKYLISI
jgi:hypothetical protein